MDLFGLGVGFSDEGELGWQVDSGIIHMEVYPTLVEPDIGAIKRSIRREPRDNQAFPQPLLVGEMYAVLRGFILNGFLAED